MSKIVHDLRKRVTVRTDQRFCLTNEIIKGARLIKMYGWEIIFERLARTARRKEMNVLSMVNYLKGASSASFFYINRTTLFATILVYVLNDDYLTIDEIFMLFQFYTTIQNTMSIALLQGLQSYAEAIVTIDRIQVCICVISFCKKKIFYHSAFKLYVVEIFAVQRGVEKRKSFEKM